MGITGVKIENELKTVAFIADESENQAAKKKIFVFPLKV